MNGRSINLVYLFIGQDIVTQDGLSKKYLALKRIKEQSMPKAIEDFNLDTLYARELNLKELQEKLLFLPAKSTKRIIVIKEAQGLKEDIREFILTYVKNPHQEIILILDAEFVGPKDSFIGHLYNYAKVFRFKETVRLDTFALGRSIDHRNSEEALKILNQLLEDGEKPERILGGLRFAWGKGVSNHHQIRKKLKLLLDCDIDIKTGRLKPTFALEKLIVNLCSLGKSFS